MPCPARLMWKFSIDIAERNGALLRRLLCSAERLSDSATARGLRLVKTRFSRVRALLVRITRADHRRAEAVAMHKGACEHRARSLTARDLRAKTIANHRI